MSKTTSRPYATALLIDFLLSQEGQEVMSTVGTRNGGRNDVSTYADPEALMAKNLILYTPSLVGTAYEKYSKLFDDLFIRGL